MRTSLTSWGLLSAVVILPLIGQAETGGPAPDVGTPAPHAGAAGSENPGSDAPGTFRYGANAQRDGSNAWIVFGGWLSRSSTSNPDPETGVPSHAMGMPIQVTAIDRSGGSPKYAVTTTASSYEEAMGWASQIAQESNSPVTIQAPTPPGQPPVYTTIYPHTSR